MDGETDMSRRMTWALAGIALAAAAYFGWMFTARNAYESAEYTVIEADGLVELREYPDLMLAATPMQPEYRGGDGSFRRLFGYISGGNSADQKIAMTVPVFMERDSANSDASMGFVVPKSVTASGIPTPAQDQVRIKQRTGGRFAVIRFSGRLSESLVNEQERILRSWMASQGLTGDEAAETAGYDPPWTPGPLRRNEVLIRVLENDASSRM